MTTPETPLRDIFYPQGTGIPNGALIQAIPKEKLAIVLPKFGEEMLDAVQKDMKDSTDKLLQMTPLEILVKGWNTHREVTKAIEDSRKKPDDPILKPLVKHTVKSVHHPFIEFLLDEVSVWKVEFEIVTSLEVEGAILKIQNGQMTHLLGGTAQGKFKLSCFGVTLKEAQTSKFDLPGEIRLKPEHAKSMEVRVRQAYLDGVKGEIARMTFPLVDGLEIGRLSSCSIHLTDPTVSRRHAHLRSARNQWFIQDMGSRIGTFINGNKIDAAPLRNGDHIRIGDAEFEFRE